MTSPGRGAYGGGRTMMRSPQQSSLHVAVRRPDRGEALGRKRTVLSRKHPVVGVSSPICNKVEADLPTYSRFRDPKRIDQAVQIGCSGEPHFGHPVSSTLFGT
jgi:hypothetical protein